MPILPQGFIPGGSFNGPNLDDFGEGPPIHLTKPCPRCQTPLAIPQPPPPQIRCSKCGAVIKKKASAGADAAASSDAVSAGLPTPKAASSAAPAPLSAPPAAAPPAAAPSTASSQRHLLLLLGALAGVGVLGLAGVVCLGSLFWLGRSELSPPGKSEPVPPGQEPFAQWPKPRIDPAGIQPAALEPPVLQASPKVQAALERGVSHLKKRLQERKAHYTGEFANSYSNWQRDMDTGATALAGLALLEARVAPQDPAIQQALASVRQGGPSMRLVYTLGTSLIFLNRLHEAQPLEDADRALLRRLALRLVAHQLQDGYWTYDNPPILAPREEEILQQLQANTYRPTKTQPTHPPTHSMTQFALLALWGSRRHDIPARPVILTTAGRFHQTQLASGTWDYKIGRESEKIFLDSNTCAGLIALAMEKTLREDPAFRRQAGKDPPATPGLDQRCDRAFAHLGSVIGRTLYDPVNETPSTTSSHGTIFKADAWGDYYFLWCLERVAVIYDKKTIAGKDWYGWGSEIILKNQRADGSWQDRHGDVPDTCFAMLFLARANLAKDLTESIRRRAN